MGVFCLLRLFLWGLIASTGSTPFLLEHKEYVKYLGVLIDSHLSWKYHIDYVASKVSKIVGVIARLRHFVPVATLRSIYQSLIIPYLSYGLAVWAQAAKSQLNKLWLLQKRVIRMMYFLKPTTHAIPFFLSLRKYYPYKCSSLNLYRTLCMIYQTTSPNPFIHITLGPLLLTNFTFNIQD